MPTLHSRRRGAILGQPLFGLALLPVMLAAQAAAAPALPTGGKVVAGQASIGSAKGSTLTIDQTSSRAIIDWSSFSIGAAAKVQFDNGSGATLNRVTGTRGSILDGMLSGTGSVYLLNPNGVVIGRHGVVNLGGTFVASTLDVADSAFMAGGALTFSGASPASVVNEGKIGSLGGDVALIAARVENDGTMQAARGDAGILSGYRVLIRDKTLNDGKFAVLLGGADTSATNAGIIEAASAEVRANGGNVYALAGNTGGIVKAMGVSSSDGKVFLIAKGGAVSVAGSIQAQGAGGKGGFVETSGDRVHVADGARISTLAAGGATGTWLIDPNDFKIAASGGDISGATLSANLGGSDVAILSSDGGAAGNGDILVDDTVSWGSPHTLSLSAFRNIAVNANITVSGAGGLSLTTNTGAGGGDYVIAPGASISFTGGSGAGASLTINGVPYTLLYSMADVQGINASSAALQGDYAVATTLTAFAISQWAPIGTPGDGTVSNSGAGFSGVFAGLGHAITSLTVNIGAGYAGLFGYSSGVIRDIGVSGTVSGSGNDVGGLAGYSGGSVTDAYSFVAVNGGGNDVGGLVGANAGSIIDAYAVGAVAGVSGFGSLGGLVGSNAAGGSISQSWATGAVSGGSGSMGGLAGQNEGSILQSWAGGSVTGAAGSHSVGGLVGYQTGSGSISQSYALGAVSGSDYVGGLLGANSSNGTADQSYATGLVASAGANVGGLMGYGEGGAVTNSYWDIDTTGQGGSFGGTGLHTSAFFTASNLGGFTFGTTPGAGGWVIVDQNGTLNNASGAPGGTRPMLLSEWSANIVNAHQLQLTALDLGAAYTLAANIDASATADANPADVWAPSGFAPIGGSASNFTGAFNGEGHAITGLTIDQPTGSDVGLFGATSSTSVVEDLSLVGGSITALANVGALAGTSGGTVSNVQSSVDVTGFFLVGGLIGEASGSITGAGVSGTTTGEIVPGSSSSGNPGPLGGLIGQLDAGSVTGSHVTGAVTAADGSSIGGLIGTTNTGATVDSSYATGAVTANPVTNGGSQIGGLIGDNLGAVTNSYATGAVTGEFMVGGLIGTNDSTGSVARSYATGAVAAAVDASLGLSGLSVGGLIGFDNGAKTTTDVYAQGSVTGGDSVGGLIGELENNLTNAYSTGRVSVAAGGSGTNVGGLIGLDDFAGVITNAYWDTQTSGITDPTRGAGDATSDPGITAQTTAQLQGVLPTGFSNTVWGTGADLYPYFLWQYPSAGGTPQAISGLAYADSGVTALKAGQVSLLIDGAALGSASSGANGYYYFLEAPGTIQAGGSAVLASTGGANPGARVDTLTGTTGGFDIWGATLIAPTVATAYTAASATSLQSQDAALIAQAVGGNTDPTVGLANFGYIATGAGFTLDTPQTLSNGLYVETKAASSDITVAGAITLPGSEGLTLIAVRNIDFGANVTVTGGGALSLATGGDYSLIGHSITFTGGSGAGASLTINGSPYALLYTMADVQAINSGVTADYALATSLDATGVSGWIPIGTDGAGNILGLAGFGGVFAGLGHAISNLTVDIGSNNYAGLFGYSSGAIRDIGLIGGSVNGSAFVGALAGANTGTITDAYATGAVSGGSSVGGLVGDSVIGSTITDAYATGAVSGSGSVGGLVGYLGGAITDAYATGAVSGSSSDVGGLVGAIASGGTVTDAYATGAVSGSSNVGGLVGLNNGGSITDGYYDAGTTGQPLGLQTDGSTGMTTTALQAGLPSGFSSVTWSIVAGETYPYLSWQFPNGTPQVVSGFAYGAGAKTSLVDAAVAAWSKGTTLTSTLTGGGVTSGANGYYYYLLAPGTLAASTSSQVGITVTPAGGPSVSGLSFSGGFSVADGSVLGLNATSGLVYARTAETTDSALIFDLAAAFGAANYASLSAALAGSNLQVQSLGDFAIDKAVNIGSATAILDIGGVLTESGSGAVTAFRLNGSAVGGVALTASGNKIAHVNSFTNTGAGGFSLTDGESLVTATIGAGTGDLTLTTTGSGSGLFVNGQLSAGGTIALNSSGGITENAFGALLASSLTGSSVGGASMAQSANQFATLTSFTNTGGGPVSLTDGSALSIGGLTDTGGNISVNDTGALGVTGLVNAGVHVLKLVATGSVTESGSGAVDAGYLTGSGAGGVGLAGANLVGRIAGFTNTGAGGFSLADGETLAVTGAVNSGTGDLTLTTTGASHGLYVSAPLTAGATLTLTSGGQITENGSGTILATTFSGASVGGANLALAANQFGSLSTFTDTGGGNVSIADSSSLSITGLVSIGSGQLTLTDTGSVSETGAGAIDAGHLAGGAATGASLNGANLVSHLNGFTVSGTGDLSLTDGQTLDVVAPVSVNNGTLSLTTTAGNIDFQGSVSANAVNLVSAAQALEFSTGAIATGLLNVTAQTGILLTSSNNNITAVGTDSTTTGPNKINKQ